MPFSLNLPFAVCYPAAKLIRNMRPRRVTTQPDQAAYVERQYRDTQPRYERHMQGVDLKDKSILDVGCGLGGRAVGWLELGAVHVINIDINRQELNAGKEIVARNYPKYADSITFHHPDEMSQEKQGDVAILFDCFEHFVEPHSVLQQVYYWLKPGGLVWIGSIGWYNYMASHCMGTIPIPWCQVIFSEKAILKTIRKFLHSPGHVPNIWEQMEGLDRWDNVTTLRDRPGEPLNMLSLRKVRRILRESPFEIIDFQCFGFSGRKRYLSRVATPLARIPGLDEFFHSYYTAVLVKPEDS